jgi:hypothetical protein
LREFASLLRNLATSLERDQQKWKPVLRPIALQNSRMAHDLIAKTAYTLADHAQNASNQ